jgi:hypothetical protein
MSRITALITALITLPSLCACVGAGDSSDDLDDADTYESALVTPIQQQSGAWWNHVDDPTVNQLWAKVDGVTPDAHVKGSVSFQLTCTVPPSMSLKPDTLDAAHLSLLGQVDSTNVVVISNVPSGSARTITIPTTQFADGWHEIRIRCKAKETLATEAGKVTAITNGFPLYFENGKAIGSGQNHGTNYVDAHGWYDTDPATGDAINYVYAQLKNVHSLIDAPLKGTVSVSGRAWNSGATTIDHFAVKIDGIVIAQFAGTTQTRTISLDTTKLSNGAHTLSMHSHGMAASGKQLAAEAKVPITISN